MITTFFKQNKLSQYLFCIFTIACVSVVCYSLSDLISYHAVALLLLATISFLSMFFPVFPILVAASLSALIWDFFFIPPHFTLAIALPEDVLMLVMYFVIVLLNGVLKSKMRQYEKSEHQKEERKKTIKLYKTLFDSISHELRTPIATIVGATDNLQSKTSLPLSEDNKTKLVDEISIAALRLNRLVDNLLNMQRLESGFLKPKMDWCDLNELIMNIQHRLKTELESHTVLVDVDQDFPLIKLDAGLFEQAIYNIVYNATVYTPADSEIKIEGVLQNDLLCMTISDNGPGFEQEHVSNVFTKYFYSNKNHKGGIGLGLSISKGFVEAHGGHIEVENQEGSGAKFTIMLPVEVFVIGEGFDLSDLIIKEQDGQ